MFVAKFHLVSRSSGLYIGVSTENTLVIQARTCRNEASLLWHWEGSHLVTEEGSAVTVKRVKEGETALLVLLPVAVAV